MIYIVVFKMQWKVNYLTFITPLTLERHKLNLR